jgi:hypothetical protein
MYLFPRASGPAGEMYKLTKLYNSRYTQTYIGYVYIATKIKIAEDYIFLGRHDGYASVESVIVVHYGPRLLGGASWLVRLHIIIIILGCGLLTVLRRRRRIAW